MHERGEQIQTLLTATGFFCVPVACFGKKGFAHLIGFICIKNSSVIFFRIDHAKDAKTRIRNKAVIGWVTHGGEAFVVSSLEDVVKALKSLGLDEPVRVTSGYVS